MVQLIHGSHLAFLIEEELRQEEAELASLLPDPLPSDWLERSKTPENRISRKMGNEKGMATRLFIKNTSRKIEQMRVTLRKKGLWKQGSGYRIRTEISKVREDVPKGGKSRKNPIVNRRDGTAEKDSSTDTGTVNQRKRKRKQRGKVSKVLQNEILEEDSADKPQAQSSLSSQAEVICSKQAFQPTDSPERLIFSTEALPDLSPEVSVTPKLAFYSEPSHLHTFSLDDDREAEAGDDEISGRSGSTRRPQFGSGRVGRVMTTSRRPPLTRQQSLHTLASKLPIPDTSVSGKDTIVYLYDYNRRGMDGDGRDETQAKDKFSLLDHEVIRGICNEDSAFLQSDSDDSSDDAEEWEEVERSLIAVPPMSSCFDICEGALTTDEPLILDEGITL